MSRQIPLHLYPPRAAAWRRLGILIWCVTLLIAVFWTALFIWGLNIANNGGPWTGSSILNLGVFWVPGVLPFIVWTIIRWVVGGFWTLKP